MNTTTTTTTIPDWDTVVAHMHYNGDSRDALTQPQADQVWLLADGFGRQTIGFIREQCYDWSHIRDSSPAAIAAMADRIRHLVAS